MGRALVLYPNQLFALEYFPEDITRTIFVEEPLFFGNDEQYPSHFHKQKLAMHRASMRRYLKEVLWEAGYEVDYLEHHVMKTSADVLSRCEDVEEVLVFDVVDDILRRRLTEACETSQRKLTWLGNPNFYLKRQEAADWFQSAKTLDFASFYKWQRERFNVLLTSNYRPAGSKWMHDSESIERIPEGKALPGFAVFGDNDYVAEAIDYVNKYFPDNYGSLEQIPWPTNHAEATQWLQEFVKNRLKDSGMFRDSIEEGAPWLFHGALSASLNIGLLSPMQIIESAVSHGESDKIPLTSLEPFVRSILGWREFYRGLYESRHASLRTKNEFANSRSLSNDWYSATTGLPPLDSAIRNIYARAYVHEAERTDVMGSAMLMSEIDPKAVYQFFNEMMIDGYDWLTVPRVYGFSQCVDGGELAKIIPLFPSSNILARGHYQKGDWCDVWDGLYSRFIDTHEKALNKNPNMHLVIRSNQRMNADRKRIIGYRAEDFLTSKTITK